MPELRLPNINQVIISGRLANDMNLKYTGSGFPIGTFSLANTHVFKQNDEWKNETSFINITILGKLAESLSESLAKGMPVIVEGRLRQRSWDKDGVKQYMTDVIANRVNILVKKEGSVSPEKQSDEPGVITEDEIPF